MCRTGVELPMYRMKAPTMRPATSTQVIIKSVNPLTLVEKPSIIFTVCTLHISWKARTL